MMPYNTHRHRHINKFETPSTPCRLSLVPVFYLIYPIYAL